ncbi:unnamed protein product [Clonostachys rhizophaga]|uniref:Xaa-Pro aminopeptidase n=2 Tax=Clonostachys TaxID=110564 RepID=A0A9N9VFG3_9HYPO|nr:unnamed protein product [Clonostachys rhizophaga]
MVAENFDAVLEGKYPAKNHAKRTLELIRKEIPDANGLLYLEARHTKLLEDNDSPEPFRYPSLYPVPPRIPFGGLSTVIYIQRRFFYYLTGSNLADSFFTFDIQTSKSTLFIPPVEADEVIWSGLPVTAEEALAQYDVDEVKFTTDVNSVLSSYASANPNSTIFAIEGQISDHIKISDFQNKNLSVLKKSIEVARVVKDEYEVAIIRKANYVSALAHKAVIEKSRTAKNEQELLATFLATCIENGAAEMAYHPILAAGEAAATLHYVHNNRTLENKTNLLIDAGAEWNNYASDITRTFPLNGKFTPESRAIYDIVLKMQEDTMALIKAGASWDDIHVVAHKVAIDGLLSIGILKGDKQEILDSRTSSAFFPHGLGHHLGLDTHDTGGNPNPKDKDILFRYLRLRGTLPAGSVVTVEPGVYFCRFIIEPYLKDPKHSKFIDTDVLDKYWSVGGVRIEDNVFVTEAGYENLTTAVKKAEDVEAIALA